jgi:hypothetical protein
VFWITCGPLLDVLGRIAEYKLPVSLREAVPIKDEGVQKLSTCSRHEKPGSEPPWFVLEVPSVF